MRTLILSDLHSNLEALQAVVEATRGAYDQVVCCGDLVGYGPDPDPVVDWVRENVTQVVRGNHDKACCGLDDAEDFSENARLAAFWTRDHLRSDNMEYLRNLPQGPLEILCQFAILHGSPRDEDEYVTTPWAAVEAFKSLTHRISFFGHTHLQGGFVKSGDRIAELPSVTVPQDETPGEKPCGMLELRTEETYLLNPGSVGQPRDHDPRAAFAIFDTAGIVEYGRVSYDIETTMNKILQAGLPEFLAYRLTLGR